MPLVVCTHPKTPEFFRMETDGHLRCWVCKRERVKLIRQRQREVRAEAEREAQKRLTPPAYYRGLRWGDIYA